MGEPPAVVQLAEVLTPLGVERLVVVLRVRHDVPGLLVGEVVGDDVGAAALHREAEEAARGADLEHALVAEVDAAEVVVDAAAEVPRALHEPVAGELHRVVEVTVLEIGDGARLRVDGGLARRNHGLLPRHDAAP